MAWHLARERSLNIDELLERSLRDFPMTLEDVSCRRNTIEIAGDILALRGFLIVEQKEKSKWYKATDLLYIRHKRNRSSHKNIPIFAAAAMTAACGMLPVDPPQTVHQEPPSFRTLTLIDEAQISRPQSQAPLNPDVRPITWIRLGDLGQHPLNTLKAQSVTESALTPMPVIHLGHLAQPDTAAPQKNVLDNRSVIPEGEPIIEKHIYIDGPNYFANAVPVIQPKAIALPINTVPPAKERADQTGPIVEPFNPKTAAKPEKINESIEAMAEAAAMEMVEAPPAAGKISKPSSNLARIESHQNHEHQVMKTEPPEEKNLVEENPNLTDDQQIDAFLNQWAQDWFDKNIEATLSHYAKSFLPDRMSRADWENWRRKALSRKGDIDLTYDIRKIDVKGDRATVLIWQSYKSPYLKSRIGKEFILYRQDGDWNIHRETIKESAISKHA